MATGGKLRKLRCSMVVMDVFPLIMQDLMNYSKVLPSTLYNKIKKSEGFNTLLNLNDIQSIETLKTNGYTKLDVSIIYKILKYFKICIPQPSQKWGSIPKQNEIEIGDDVERIRMARNNLAHKVSMEISEVGMENFFTIFHDVAKRIDKYLDKPQESGYEQSIKNCRTLPIDEEMAEDLRKALQEIESLKEKITVHAGPKEIHILVGKTMDDIVDKIRNCDAESTTNVKFIIEGVEPEKQIELIELLNSLRGQINSHSENIHFKQATKECIALYVVMKNRVLQSESLLESEACSFIQRILSMIDLTLNLEEDISVVVTSAEDDHDPFDIPLSLSKEETNSPDIWSGNNSIVLNLEIKNEVFQTPETMQQNISEFVGNIFMKLNGKQHIRQRDIIVILEPGEEDSLVTKSTTGKETIVAKPWSSADEKVEYSDAQYAMAPSSPCKDNENSFGAGEHSQSDKAQCPLYSPSESHLVNVLPRFLHIQRGSRVMDSHTRQCMRPWLEAKIEGGQIKGLEWINRDEKIFKVPWKHGGKRDWKEQDSQIFKEWALHTGMYREGVDSSDWPTWKARFRCALYKLPDIQELKNYGKLDGPEPFRAYRLLSKHEISYGKSEETMNNSPEIQDPSSSPDCTMDESENINSMPEKVIKGEIKSELEDEVIKSANLLSDLRDLHMHPLPGSM